MKDRQEWNEEGRKEGRRKGPKGKNDGRWPKGREEKVNKEGSYLPENMMRREKRGEGRYVYIAKVTWGYDEGRRYIASYLMIWREGKKVYCRLPDDMIRREGMLQVTWWYGEERREEGGEKGGRYIASYLRIWWGGRREGRKVNCKLPEDMIRRDERREEEDSIVGSLPNPRLCNQSNKNIIMSKCIFGCIASPEPTWEFIKENKNSTTNKAITKKNQKR